MIMMVMLMVKMMMKKMMMMMMMMEFSASVQINERARSKLFGECPLSCLANNALPPFS